MPPKIIARRVYRRRPPHFQRQSQKTVETCREVVRVQAGRINAERHPDGKHGVSVPARLGLVVVGIHGADYAAAGRTIQPRRGVIRPKPGRRLKLPQHLQQILQSAAEWQNGRYFRHVGMVDARDRMGYFHPRLRGLKPHG